jgi:hypothetical protein
MVSIILSFLSLAIFANAAPGSASVLAAPSLAPSKRIDIARLSLVPPKPLPTNIFYYDHCLTDYPFFTDPKTIPNLVGIIHEFSDTACKKYASCRLVFADEASQCQFLGGWSAKATYLDYQPPDAQHFGARGHVCKSWNSKSLVTRGLNS